MTLVYVLHILAELKQITMTKQLTYFNNVISILATEDKVKATQITRPVFRSIMAHNKQGIEAEVCANILTNELSNEDS